MAASDGKTMSRPASGEWSVDNALKSLVREDLKMPLFIHDMFNIVFLSIILIEVIIYLTRVDWTLLGTYEIGYSQYDLTYIICGTFIGYLIIDVIWILLIPKAVPSSPTSLIIHHAFALFQIFAVATYPWLGLSAALSLLVEINTIFLVLKRNVRQVSFEFNICWFGFYSTWLLLRLIMYPILSYYFYTEYIRHSIVTNNYYNVVIAGPLGTAVLSVLSYKWSFDMVFKKKKPKSPSKKN